MKLRQYRLEFATERLLEKRSYTVWLDYPDLKVGNLISLNLSTSSRPTPKIDGWWVVVEIFSQVDSSQIKDVRDFDSDHRQKVERVIIKQPYVTNS